MTIEKERELFKQAYLNLRTADSIPFPDAVFDEYVRLRDSEGYKLVPVDDLNTLTHWTNMMASEYGDDDAVEVALRVKAMIGACDD